MFFTFLLLTRVIRTCLYNLLRNLRGTSGESFLGLAVCVFGISTFCHNGFSVYAGHQRFANITCTMYGTMPMATIDYQRRFKTTYASSAYGYSTYRKYVQYVQYVHYFTTNALFAFCSVIPFNHCEQLRLLSCQFRHTWRSMGQ